MMSLGTARAICLSIAIFFHDAGDIGLVAAIVAVALFVMLMEADR